MNIRLNSKKINDDEYNKKLQQIQLNNIEKQLILASQKRLNHIIFNDHKYVQFINILDHHTPKCLYCIFNKEIYKLIYRTEKGKFRFGWLNIFTTKQVNITSMLIHNKLYKSINDFIISNTNKLKFGYIVKILSTKIAIGLLYDIKFNNAKHTRLTNLELQEALKSKLISKTIYNRLINNNTILGYDDLI